MHMYIIAIPVAKHWSYFTRLRHYDPVNYEPPVHFFFVV